MNSLFPSKIPRKVKQIESPSINPPTDISIPVLDQNTDSLLDSFDLLHLHHDVHFHYYENDSIDTDCYFFAHENHYFSTVDYNLVVSMMIVDCYEKVRDDWDFVNVIDAVIVDCYNHFIQKKLHINQISKFIDQKLPRHLHSCSFLLFVVEEKINKKRNKNQMNDLE